LQLLVLFGLAGLDEGDDLLRNQAQGSVVGFRRLADVALIGRIIRSFRKSGLRFSAANTGPHRFTRKPIQQE
jgi:hypothetical protein